MTDVTADEGARRHLQAIEASRTRVETIGKTGGVAWHVWGDGPALVLLHGGSGSWNHWIHTVPVFADSYRVMAADTPGLGDSPTPNEPHTIEGVAEIVSEGIDKLIPGDAQFDIVGFSFGGLMGGKIALLQSHRVRSLTIVGSPPFGLGHINPAHDITPFNQTWSFAEAVPAHRRNLELLMMADPGKVDALSIRIHHDNLRRSRLRTRKLARGDSLSRYLKETSCVVHGIWGGKDATIYPGLDEIRELFLATHPASTFDVLANTGHWAAYENPSAFNKLLKMRLEEYSPRP